jgi:hypothetical protein
MAADWKSDWVKGDASISIDGGSTGMAYWVGRHTYIDRDSVVSTPNQRYEVTGTRSERQLWGDKVSDAAASVVHRKRSGGEHFRIEAGDTAFTLDVVADSRPRIEFFAPKVSTIDVSAVMFDVTGAQVLEIDKKYRKERVRFGFLGRQMEGRFEGAVRAIHPVPTPAVLLALQLTLRPEKLLQIGRFSESGTIGG